MDDKVEINQYLRAVS